MSILDMFAKKVNPTIQLERDLKRYADTTKHAPLELAVILQAIVALMDQYDMSAGEVMTRIARMHKRATSSGCPAPSGPLPDPDHSDQR